VNLRKDHCCIRTEPSRGTQAGPKSAGRSTARPHTVRSTVPAVRALGAGEPRDRPGSATQDNELAPDAVRSRVRAGPPPGGSPRAGPALNCRWSNPTADRGERRPVDGTHVSGFDSQRPGDR